MTESALEDKFVNNSVSREKKGIKILVQLGNFHSKVSEYGLGRNENGS